MARKQLPTPKYLDDEFEAELENREPGFDPSDVATTQIRAFATLVALVFLLSTATFADGVVFREPEPNRPLSSLETERKNAPKELADAVATLASRFEIVETSVKTDDSNSNRRKTLGFLVDLNTAQKSELKNLPRIGEQLADRIVEYRDKKGGFESVDELINVKGIGEKTLEKLRPFCVVSPPDETP